jgi:hypothetical protein
MLFYDEVCPLSSATKVTPLKIFATTMPEGGERPRNRLFQRTQDKADLSNLRANELEIEHALFKKFQESRKLGKANQRSISE